MNPTPLDHLRSGLAATRRQDGSWLYDDNFIVLAGVDRAKLEKLVPEAREDRQIWMDIVATETAKELGKRCDLKEFLGSKWQWATNEWIDRAYTQGNSKGVGLPRALISTKVSLLVAEVYGVVNASKAGGSTPVGSVTCATCSRSYSARVAQCPKCAEDERAAAKRQEAEASQARAAAWRTLAPLPVGPVSWSTALEMKWCHGGSGGVFIIKLPTGAICVRGSNWNPAELFAQRLSTALGIRSATERAVHPGDAEIKEIRRALNDAQPDCEQSRLELQLVRKAQSLTVLEFVDGIVMMGMSAHEYLKAVPDDSPLWHHVGRLMAFDLLINNFDRLPLAWSNEGNLGNVMLNSSLGVVVGIDQCVQVIKHPAGLETYLTRVRRVVSEVRGGPGKAFDAVKTSINNNTAVEISTGQLGRLREGCLEFVGELASLLDSGELEQKLKAVSEEVAAIYDSGPQSLDERGLGAPEPTPQFCDLVRRVASAATEALEEPVEGAA